MHPMPIPSMVSQGQLFVMLLSVIAGVLLIIGFVLWAAAHAYEERQRVRCPVQLRMATVLFGITPDGRRTDVLRCSLFRDRPAVNCGKSCVGATAKT